jgi:hypothetical protein
MFQESSAQLAMGVAFGVMPPKQQVSNLSIVIFYF